MPGGFFIIQLWKTRINTGQNTKKVPKTRCIIRSSAKKNPFYVTFVERMGLTGRTIHLIIS